MTRKASGGRTCAPLGSGKWALPDKPMFMRKVFTSSSKGRVL